MSTTNHYKAKWRAAGLCTNCGSRPHAFLSVQCEVCLEHKRDVSKRRSGLKTIERLKRKHDLLTFNRSHRAKGCV